MNKIVIKNLYKNKLKICRTLGYEYGNWDNKQIVLEDYMEIYNLRQKYNNNNLGHFLMNNIRNRYKIRQYETDPDKINLWIDYGFHILKEVNLLKNSMKPISETLLE